MTKQTNIPFTRIQNAALLAGILGTVACLAGFFYSRHTFAVAYLVAFLYWTAILLGTLPVIMIHNLTGGKWGQTIRPLLEILARLIPWLLLAFLPLIFVMKDLYIWMDPKVLEHDSLIQAKAFYLNLPFFTFRAAAYFCIWTALAYLTTKGFQTHGLLVERRGQSSGLGLILFVLTVTFSSLDWAMSLEPHWSSTIYGFIFVIGQVLSAFAFVTILAILLSRGPLSKVLPTGWSHDLGTLLFVFVMLWTYLSLSQFLIIWSGNLPETTPWYFKRSHGGWQFVGTALVLFQFVVPFFCLLMRSVKRDPTKLLGVVGLILVMRWVDLIWYIKPAVFENFGLHALDLAAMLAIGGFVIALIFHQLQKNELAIGKSYEPTT